jgi:hypothetical protein
VFHGCTENEASVAKNEATEEIRMLHKSMIVGICWSATALGSVVAAETRILEDFKVNPQARWEYFADEVMGGVSDGRANFAIDDDTAFVRLTGTVSTENNGGFLQVRRLLSQGFPVQTEGLELDIRGNGEAYFVFLRTREMTRPWHFYNAKFQSTQDWSRVRIPFGAFERSHDFLANPIDPQSVISIGFVAYGRDHSADLSVASVGVY